MDLGLENAATARVSRHDTRQPMTRESVPVSVIVYDEDSKGRQRAERFVSEMFRRVFQAELKRFMPKIMALIDFEGKCLGSLGMRYASTGKLMLEDYLDENIEKVLSGLTGTEVRREGIVEIGNLVTSLRGGGRWLVSAITAWLVNVEFQWAVFTATSELRVLLERLGVKVWTLAAASHARLKDTGDTDWGTYYEHQPIVIATRVADVHNALLSHPQTTEPMQKILQMCGERGRQDYFRIRTIRTETLG